MWPCVSASFSLHIDTPRLIPVAAHVMPLWVRVVHGTDTMYFVYPFSYWCPAGLFPSIGYCQQCCLSTNFCLNMCFHFWKNASEWNCWGFQVVLRVKNLLRVDTGKQLSSTEHRMANRKISLIRFSDPLYWIFQLLHCNSLLHQVTVSINEIIIV